MKVVQVEQRKGTDGKQEEMINVRRVAGWTASLSYKDHRCPSKVFESQPTVLYKDSENAINTYFFLCCQDSFTLELHSCPNKVVKSKKTNTLTPWCNIRVPKTCVRVNYYPTWVLRSRPRSERGESKALTSVRSSESLPAGNQISSQTDNNSFR